MERRQPLKRSGFKQQTAPTQRRYYWIACEDCGASVRRREGDPKSKATDGKVRCKPCSMKWRGIQRIGTPIPALRTGERVRCPQCGTEHYRSASRVGRGLCSQKCSAQWKLDNSREPAFMRNPSDNRGSKNGRHRDGKRIGQNVKYNPKTKIREAVIERDGGNWCLKCGRPGPGLHLHRVIYGSQGGEYELGNCVQLCPEDHALVHSSKVTWAPLLLGHLADPQPAETARAMNAVDRMRS